MSCRIFAPPPQPLSLLPESAPFTPAQRAWLNGFFAGLISVSMAAPSRICRRRSPPP